MTGQVFVVDLANCIGCQTCRLACRDRAESAIGDGVLCDPLQIVVGEGGIYPEPHLTFRVVHCFHCAEPACEAACSVGALTRGEDGWVCLDDAMCIGCGACVDACPFGAVEQLPSGKAAKCDGCADELLAGRAPVCVRACPMRALDLALSPVLPPGRIVDAAFDGHGLRPSVVYLRRDVEGVGRQ